MKKLLLMLFCCILSVAAWSQQSRPPRVVSINGTYTSTRTLQPFLGSHNLHALAISGSVTLNSDTSLVRVIMHDVDGKSYLMYEASPMLINGYTETFTDANEETEWMCGVVPQDLKIVVKDATCTVTGLTATQYSADNHPLRAPAQRDSIRIRQVQAKVDKINAYNKANGFKWYATVRNHNLLKYNDKSQDDEDFDYIDYYGGGIMEIGAGSNNGNAEVSNLVSQFDWRSRHGINWTTCIRNQMFPEIIDEKQLDSGYCIQFAALGAVEALENIYYNRKIDSDYSEQDLRNMFENGSGSWSDNVSMCLVNDGVTIEDSCHLSYYDNKIRKSTWPITKVTNYKKVFSTNFIPSNSSDSIKSALIHHGPMLSSISKPNHAMTLLGYKVVAVGDTIETLGNNDYKYQYKVNENDRLVGSTCWIFKDSYGLNHPYDCSGYMYIVFNNYNDMTVPIYYEAPMIYSDETNAVPSVYDRDGDGYYTWGFNQPKPVSLPDWVPEEQDGDDSDPTIGMMDRYGFLQSSCINDTILITEDTDWDEFHYVRSPIVIEDGVIFTISAECKVVPNVTIVARNDSSLNIKNKGFEKVSIIAESNAKVNINQNSRLNISRSNSNSVSLRRMQ